jgi:hypothetical protein
MIFFELSFAYFLRLDYFTEGLDPFFYFGFEWLWALPWLLGVEVLRLLSMNL